MQYDTLVESICVVVPKLDSKIGGMLLTKAWPEIGKMYFEHYKKRQAAQDLLFGIPMSAISKIDENGMPTAILKMFQEIEKRGFLI